MCAELLKHISSDLLCGQILATQSGSHPVHMTLRGIFVVLSPFSHL